MNAPDPIILPIRSDEDVVRVRHRVRETAISAGFNLIEQTKIVTAASELARNVFQHGGGGDARIERVQNGARRGLRLTFTDQGPGIPNIERALTDGFTTRGGLGLGLGGSKRLVHEFDVVSRPGEGTRIVVTRWA